VSSANIGTYKVATSQAIAISFDSPIDDTQPLANFVSLRSGNTVIDTTLRVSGTTVTLQPKTPLTACTDIKLVVAAGLTSSYGVGGGTAWEYTSRTICQKSYNIGTSVQGRSITAYSFGTGATHIIFVGGTHGDEKSSTYILNSFIEDLEKNYRTIPANKTVIVIPNLNPDGFAASSRLNANGIDLNRNFPADNWQTDVYIPGNVFKPGGGGSAPLSEPESSALATFILQKQPRLVLTYHAVARLVISNDAGDSYALAQLYASKSGFGALMNSASHGAFEYDSTGEFEDWLHDKQNIPALLVELATTNQNEFSTHTQAMWSMLQ
jgi:protein MpaA